VEERTAELTASQAQLRQLTNRLVTVQEDERRHISRELHDEAGQALVTVRYSLAAVASELPDQLTAAKKRLADSLVTIDQTMDEIRTLAHSLRPPVLDVGGIHLSLKDYCQEFTQRTGLPVHYQGEEIPFLPDEIGISLFRFVQEALTNILKHAHATNIKIKLEYHNQQIRLSVSDNGRGMVDPSQSDGVGLLGIEERLKLLGGELQIHSREGGGARLVARIPWGGGNAEK